MKRLALLLLLCSCANTEYVIQRKAGTCVTSKEYPEVYEVVYQWGWEIKLKEAGVKNSPVYQYTNDKKWIQVECPVIGVKIE